jgi:hypothetical protein
MAPSFIVEFSPLRHRGSHFAGLSCESWSLETVHLRVDTNLGVVNLVSEFRFTHCKAI